MYKRARELGLELVPAEVGPQLRLQYKDQPIGEMLYIAMEPIAESDSKNTYVFFLTHGASLSLTIMGSIPAVWSNFDGRRRIIFTRQY